MDDIIKKAVPREEDMRRLGAQLSTQLKAGDVVFLSGDLGAGKSTFARGVIQAFAPDAEAPSPTFTFLETYETRDLTLFHYDLYRLETPDEVWELGLDDAIDNGAVLIEWPERIGAISGVVPLSIQIHILKDGRTVTIKGGDNWTERLVEAGIVAD